MTLRTRNTAWKVFVRGRRWLTVRRYSIEWRFGWIGKSGVDGPSTAISAACTSKGCLASGVSTSVPVTMTAAPMFSLEISVKFGSSAPYTICTWEKNVPSERLMKPKFLLARRLRTQPPTLTVCPANFSVSLKRERTETSCSILFSSLSEYIYYYIM